MKTKQNKMSLSERNLRHKIAMVMSDLAITANAYETIYFREEAKSSKDKSELIQSIIAQLQQAMVSNE